MIVTLTGCAAEEAAAAIVKADGDVKLAVLIARGLERNAAEALLAKTHGNLRAAIAEIGPG
jgi:N-acetylmuramic acid 6-phosphate etherase